jgi:hypothetical protein
VKDQYVGDINDYLKYALLRRLAGTTGLAIGWMLTASDERRDGQRLTYLQRPAVYRSIDPILFDLLAELVMSEQRSVAAVQASRLLGESAYLSELLKHDVVTRDAYFERLAVVSKGHGTVFFDPDNGLEVPSVPRGHRSSPKYLYWHEVAATFRQGHSLVIYQHFPRKPRQAFLASVFARARSEIGCTEVLAFTTPHTAFLVVPQPEDAERMARSVAELSRRTAHLGTAFSLVRAHP